MKGYKRVLVALALSAQFDRPLLKRVRVLQQLGSEIYLLHSVEHLSHYGAAYGIASGVDVEQSLLEEANVLITKVRKRLKLPEDHVFLNTGPAKSLILDVAKNIAADLIVVGSHGIQGARLLLGSTSNAVLHGALCDILAVRIKDHA